MCDVNKYSEMFQDFVLNEEIFMLMLNSCCKMWTAYVIIKSQSCLSI